MGGREKMLGGAKPLLEDGETIHRIFPAASGVNPLLPIAGIVVALVMTNTTIPIYVPLVVVAATLVLMWQAGNLVVAVTDRAVVVMEAGTLFAYRPRVVRGRLPADTVIGPATGFLWRKMEGLSGTLATGVRVHTRFVKDAVGSDGRH